MTKLRFSPRGARSSGATFAKRRKPAKKAVLGDPPQSGLLDGYPAGSARSEGPRPIGSTEGEIPHAETRNPPVGTRCNETGALFYRGGKASNVTGRTDCRRKRSADFRPQLLVSNPPPFVEGAEPMGPGTPFNSEAFRGRYVSGSGSGREGRLAGDASVSRCCPLGEASFATPRGGREAPTSLLERRAPRRGARGLSRHTFRAAKGRLPSQRLRSTSGRRGVRTSADCDRGSASTSSEPAGGDSGGQGRFTTTGKSHSWLTREGASLLGSASIASLILRGTSSSSFRVDVMRANGWSEGIGPRREGPLLFFFFFFSLNSPVVVVRASRIGSNHFSSPIPEKPGGVVPPPSTAGRWGEGLGWVL